MRKRKDIEKKPVEPCTNGNGEKKACPKDQNTVSAVASYLNRA